MYKCLNGLVEPDMNFITQQEQHDYNTRTKLNLRLPSFKRNWGKQRTAFHAITDFNSLSQTIRQSVNLNIFKRNLFKVGNLNEFHAIKNFDSLSQAIRQSMNLNIFKRIIFKFVI